LSHTYSQFCSRHFGNGVLRTICTIWPQIMIHLISHSQVARITGVSHSHPALSETFAWEEPWSPLLFQASWGIVSWNSFPHGQPYGHSDASEAKAHMVQALQ
jgi:hypothetical protein